MDIGLFAELQEGMPEFNQDILDGLACKSLEFAKEEVDSLIQCAESSFPEGFEYLGSFICSPQKALRVMTGGMSRSEKMNAVDLSSSNTYLVEYRFRFDGVDLHPRYFFLPFVREGGLITIAGKQFSISPVLADPGFSVGEDYVFIRMSRAPVTFKRVSGSVVIDGQRVARNIPWSKLHWKGGSRDKRRESDNIFLGKAVTTLPHYLFCKYGVTETFRRFAGTEVIITNEEELLLKPLDKEKYILIRSTGDKPTAFKRRIEYKLIATDVVVAIPRDRMCKLTFTLVNGFFYVLDHYPAMRDPYELDKPWHWKVWLAYFLWGDQLGHDKLVENVDTHLNSLDDYVDLLVKKNLLDEEGLIIEDIYELFIHIIQNMDEMIESKGGDLATMYGKRLVVAPYVLRDIYEQVFKCLFEIVNNRKRVYTAADYNQTLGKFFTPTKISDLRKTSKKPFVSSVSTPSDNMYYKITSRVVQQSQTSARKKSNNINVYDPMNWLHSSTLEAGNYLVLPKSSPLARNTINPTVQLDGRNTIVPKEHMKDLVAYVDSIIRRD